ncbi:hypothetical protein [Celeribacter persicus]|uniref:Uncharacterized protein n=1 Tax=Celeribacter persicus TaxID=1651082 RepID=A0A2T5HMB8_9RHOB|nr:hypothetical protein [Celeribacter persicus]PTQ72728.1 hypothetical protein C8N42_106240 [Celeribacter persicus]
MAKSPRPQTQAKQNAVALLQAAREAGWARARFELKPDGTTVIDASMTDPDGGDDFLSGDLRMGK